jgi:hypothetical protein
MRADDRRGGCIVPKDQAAALELIAAQLAYLRAQAEANDLNLVAFLIDVALSEAREELANSARTNRPVTDSRRKKAQTGTSSTLLRGLNLRAGCLTEGIAMQRKSRLSNTPRAETTLCSRPPCTALTPMAAAPERRWRVVPTVWIERRTAPAQRTASD